MLQLKTYSDDKIDYTDAPIRYTYVTSSLIVFLKESVTILRDNCKLQCAQPKYGIVNSVSNSSHNLTAGRVNRMILGVPL